MERILEYNAQVLDADAGVLRIHAPDGRVMPDLAGRHLEAVYADERHALLFVTYDILHEEQLDICLIEAGEVVDRLAMGQMFQAADVSNIQQHAPRVLSFNFPASQSWALEVSTALQFTLPDLRSMVSRMRVWRSFFKLTRSVSP